MVKKPIVDINKALSDVTNLVDDSFESADERQQTNTERQRIDLTSPYKLPHLIRPIITLWSMGLFTFVVVFGAITGESDPYIIGAVASVMFSAIGFYFDSRKREKIAYKQAMTETKKAEAAIKIETIRAKMEVKEDKKDSRIERRERRRAARDSD